MIGLIGMPGSGKSEASAVSLQMGIPVLVMGDVIREEALRRGLEPNDENLGKIGNQLREMEGPAAVAERCMQNLARILEVENREHLKEVLASKKGLVVVEGIRSREEIELFKEYFADFQLVEIFVPLDIRLKRMAERKRSDDPKSAREGKEHLTLRDRRELGWGMSEAVREATVRINNDSNLDDLRRRIKSMLKSILAES